MVNGPLISIIMPVYNSHEYLEDTINSIISQSYPNFELLIVNDGSTDGSYDICRKAAEKDARIQLFTQTNHGLCYSRNRALENAKGKYIAFCDHDDFYEINYLEILVKAAEQYNADLVKGKYKGVLIDNSNHEIESVEREFLEGEITVCDLLKDYRYFATTINVLWNGLYRKDIIFANHIMFDTRFKNGCEDNSFNLDYLKYTKKIYGLNDLLYTHVRRMGVSASLGFRSNRIDDYQMIFSKEARFLEMFLSDLDAYNYMRHQSRYLNLLRNELSFDDCVFSYNEKRQRVKEFINATYEFKRINMLDIVGAIKKNKAFTLRWLMFHFRFYGLLLFSWGMHS